MSEGLPRSSNQNPFAGCNGIAPLVLSCFNTLLPILRHFVAKVPHSLQRFHETFEGFVLTGKGFSVNFKGSVATGKG
jgi:hypothetical protein